MAKASSFEEAVARGGYTAWNEGSARADFAATGGPDFPDGGGGSGNGGGGWTPLSAPDLAKLREEVYGIISPYYEELAKQAKGDFDLAVKMMQDDYSRGVRQAKEELAYSNKYGQEAFVNALDTLGATFEGENLGLVDNLNKRGMAVYQNLPGDIPNVVTPGTFEPTYDFSNYTASANVSASPTMATTGYGGKTLDRLRRDQRLRAQAEMRARMQPLEAAGINFKQLTNPQAGFDPTKPSSFTGDRSQLGSLEGTLLSKYNTATQDYRDTSQRLANEKISRVNELASGFAANQVRSLGSELTNQLQKQYTTDFLKGGIV